MMASIDDEVVTPWLARNRFHDCRIEQIVAFGCSKRGAQIGGVFLTETHVQSPCARYSHPIARFAEIVGQRRNEAEAAAGLGDFDVARRPAAAIVDILEREAFGQAGPYDRQRKVLIEAAFADLAKRHHLDES